MEPQSNMENEKPEDVDAHLDEPDLHMVQPPALQLRALWAELKAGLRGVSQEIAALQQSNICLEEKVSECQKDTAEKILFLRNTLNTLQEDTDTALSQIYELNTRQKELQTDLDLLQRTQHRTFSMGEEPVEGHTSPCTQTQLKMIPYSISNLPTNQSKRQVAALELLESERVYVSFLSMLLKANITYNGNECSIRKNKRLFPSSLRFLIQQHLELLHLLQERVLKSHWQGIMGDVFLRITSKESDFLDNYVSYLKELPACLSAASLFSKPVGLLKSDITGDETPPSLQMLLLQPVQRIPEYLRLLQSLLRRTESEHPDYHLLLMCVQHLRSFTTQYRNLLQHHQELLTHVHTHGLREHTHNLLCTHHPDQMTRTHKELSSELAHGQSITKSNRFHTDISFGSDSESPPKATPTRLHKIPEMERAGSSLGDAMDMDTFLPYRERDSRCSSRSHSTDSSIDIAFVSRSAALHPDRQSQSRGRSNRAGVYRPDRGGCVSSDSAGVTTVKRKSKSLNGLQLDTVEGHTHGHGYPVHPRLVRQSSSPERHHDANTHTIAEITQHLHKESDLQMWEEFKWKGVSDKADHASQSDRNRKESKGFRNSFKKLFKKRSGGQSKSDRAVEKAEGQSSSELESGMSNRARHPGDRDRGTAV